MRKAAWLLSGLTILGLAMGLAAQAPDAGRIQGLIKQLADSSFKVRKAAKAELEQLGAAAVPALKQACQNPDPEVAAAARELYVKLHGVDLLATLDLAAYYAPDELLYLTIPHAEQVRAGLRQMPLTRLLKDPAGAAFRTALRDKFRQEFGQEGVDRFLADLVVATQGPAAVGFQGGGDRFASGRLLGVINFAKPERAAACLESLPHAGAPATVVQGVQARTAGDEFCAIQGGRTLALWAVEHHGNGDEEGEGALVPALMKRLDQPPKDGLANQAGYRELVKWAGAAQGHVRVLITPTILAMPELRNVADMLGLRAGMELQATESITKEHGEHTRARVWVPPGQEVGGALAALRPAPLTRKSWARLPAGLSGFATYNHADHAKAFGQLLAAIRIVAEHDVAQFERDLGQVQQQFGVDLREELLSQIDGEVTLALGCRPLPAAADTDRRHRDLPFTADLALFCQVKKPDALEVSLRHLFAFLAKEGHAALGKREFRGGTLYVVPKEVTDGVHEPCFFVHDGWLYVGSTPESVTQLRWDPAAQEPKPLLESARCKEALAQLPKDAGLVAYLDVAAQAPAWLPLLTLLMEEGNLKLPPIKPDLMAKYLTPATLWVIPAAGNSLELDYRAPVGVHSTLLYGLAGAALDAEE